MITAKTIKKVRYKHMVAALYFLFNYDYDDLVSVSKTVI